MTAGNVILVPGTSLSGFFRQRSSRPLSLANSIVVGGMTPSLCKSLIAMQLQNSIWFKRHTVLYISDDQSIMEQGS